MREKFLKWYRSNYWNCPDSIWNEETEQFHHLDVELAWRSWQTAVDQFYPAAYVKYEVAQQPKFYPIIAGKCSHVNAGLTTLYSVA